MENRKMLLGVFYFIYLFLAFNL